MIKVLQLQFHSLVSQPQISLQVNQWSYFSSQPLNLRLIWNLRPLAWMSLNLKWFKFKSLFKLDQSQSLVNELVSVVQLKSLASNLISLHCVYNSDQPFLVNYSGPTPLPILPTSQISTLPQIELLSLDLISWFCSIFLIFSNLGILNQLILHFVLGFEYLKKIGSNFATSW